MRMRIMAMMMMMITETKDSQTEEEEVEEEEMLLTRGNTPHVNQPQLLLQYMREYRTIEDDGGCVIRVFHINDHVFVATDFIRVYAEAFQNSLAFCFVLQGMTDDDKGDDRAAPFPRVKTRAKTRCQTIWMQPRRCKMSKVKSKRKRQA